MVSWQDVIDIVIFALNPIAGTPALVFNQALDEASSAAQSKAKLISQNDKTVLVGLITQLMTKASQNMLTDPAVAIEAFKQINALARTINEATVVVPSSTDPNFPYGQDPRPRILEANSLGLRPDDMFMASAFLMAYRNPKDFKDIAVKWLDSQSRMVQALAQSQHNPVAAYSNAFLIALLLEQQYFIRARGADDLISALKWVWGIEEASKSLVSLFSSGSQFPATIVYATAGGSENQSELMRAIAGKGESGKSITKDKPALAGTAIEVAKTVAQVAAMA